MATTAQDIIDAALQILGVLGEGTSISPAEYQTGLTVLNDMIESWNLTNLLVYCVSAHTYDFISGKQTYTLGTGGDFDMPRPTKVERASILYSSPNTVEIPLDLIDVQAWQEICVKSTSSSFPLQMYNDYNFPLMALNFWPVPSAPCKAVLYVWEQLEKLESLVDPIILPQGYVRALKFNLAVELAPYFDREPSPTTVKHATTSKYDIDDINDGTPIAAADSCFWGGRGAMETMRSRGWYMS